MAYLIEVFASVACSSTIWLSSGRCLGLLNRWHDFRKMLQVWLLSGEAVASIPVEEICDVKDLKRRLHRLHGLPPRFRQRLLVDGKDVGDCVTLHSPMDLDLVLLLSS